MELDELKVLWKEHDEKLNKSLQLNMQLLKQVNFNKAGNKLKTVLIYKVLEMVVLLFMVVYLWSFVITNITKPGYSIPAFVIIAFITSALVSDVRQLVIITSIWAERDAAVAVLQKKIEKLKLLIINYIKVSFITIPFYPLLMIIGGKIFFHVDCWAPQHRLFLMANFLMGLLLIPLFIWLYRQLSKQHIKQVWVDNFFPGSGWDQAISAQQFLNEIEAFENENDQSAILKTDTRG